MTVIRIVAFLHMAVYLGIMWYGWQSYRLLRNRSWLWAGIGFMLLLAYRADRFVILLVSDVIRDTDFYGTLISFVGGVLILIGVLRISRENKVLVTALANRRADTSKKSQG
jgi:hypothetical protein